MRITSYALLLIVVCCCNSKNKSIDKKDTIVSKHEVLVPEFQKILDVAQVKGSILIYALEDDIYYSNDYQWARKEHLPASTFKIANSIIALETGVVADDSTLFKWDGTKRSIKNWEQDLILKDAFHFSCVPCYQEIARKIGLKRMTHHLDELNYGSMKVDTTNIDLFWLEGESRISQFQQIDFLKRFYRSELPISERTDIIIKRMMVIEKNDEYTLRGKTGWSTSNGIDNGWFVGYIELSNRPYFFATNLEPEQQFEMAKFATIRKEITFMALQQLNIGKKELFQL
ncbi:class D beta-lactamase [Maribacter sp. X9]|uniref:class D beta-lactamase n=1 Tax=Maribacter sp. X9 TaxID=3402159 RepID=UPI003AF3446A